VLFSTTRIHPRKARAGTEWAPGISATGSWISPDGDVHRCELTSRPASPAGDAEYQDGCERRLPGPLCRSPAGTKSVYASRRSDLLLESGCRSTMSKACAQEVLARADAKCGEQPGESSRSGMRTRPAATSLLPGPTEPPSTRERFMDPSAMARSVVSFPASVDSFRSVDMEYPRNRGRLRCDTFGRADVTPRTGTDRAIVVTFPFSHVGPGAGYDEDGRVAIGLRRRSIGACIRCRYRMVAVWQRSSRGSIRAAVITSSLRPSFALQSSRCW
jgi:hypothetical protein